MSFRSLWVIPLSLPLFGALLACTPQIGNSCTLSTDCSTLGDRLCDSSQPDGYCTIFNCDPDTCPNSVCVAFDPSLDPACQNADQGRAPRFERTFCMKACNTDSDCRSQYACINLTPTLPDGTVNPALARRRAEVVDVYAVDGGFGYSVCMPLPLGPDGGVIHDDDAGTVVEDTDGGVPGVCKPFVSDAGSIPWTPYDAGN